jgi:hypothetical protein
MVPNQGPILSARKLLCSPETRHSFNGKTVLRDKPLIRPSILFALSGSAPFGINDGPSAVLAADGTVIERALNLGSDLPAKSPISLMPWKIAGPRRRVGTHTRSSAASPK